MLLVVLLLLGVGRWVFVCWVGDGWRVEWRLLMGEGSSTGGRCVDQRR